jgi:hypothetical protein
MFLTFLECNMNIKNFDIIEYGHILNLKCHNFDIKMNINCLIEVKKQKL